jgi:hypothetical protein
MATLQFHLVPNAKQNKVMSEHGAAIKIKLGAPALEAKPTPLYEVSWPSD